ncbi:MAG: AMP-binding protein [Myxococcota bacterium]
MPTIAELVREHAQRAPDGVALRWPDPEFDRDAPSWTSHTWSELDVLADRYAQGLLDQGVKVNDRVALFLRAGIDWLGLAMGCWRLGAVVVAPDRRVDVARALGALRQSRPRVLVGSAWVHRLRPFFPEAFSSVELAVATGSPWFFSGVRLADLGQPPTTLPETIDPARPGLVEVPDGEAARELTHHQLAERLAFEDPSPGDVALETTWSRVYAHLAAGHTTVWPKLDPQLPASLEVADWIVARAHHEVTFVVAGQEVVGHPPPSVAPVARTEVWDGPFPGTWMLAWSRQLGEAFAAVWWLPGVGPIARIGVREVRSETLDKTHRGFGVCVGRPVDDVTVAIGPVTDGPMATLEPRSAGELGEIVVQPRGGLVLDHEDAEQEERRTIGGAWHRTGWLGYLDEDERIWVSGEMAHRIETASGIVTPLVVEGLFDADAEVADCVLVGVGPKGSAFPVLVVELHAGRTLTPDLLARWQTRESETPLRGTVRRYLAHPGLPKTQAGRVDRARLATWAAARCPDFVREGP